MIQCNIHFVNRSLLWLNKYSYYEWKRNLDVEPWVNIETVFTYTVRKIYKIYKLFTFFSFEYWDFETVKNTCIVIVLAFFFVKGEKNREEVCCWLDAKMKYSSKSGSKKESAKHIFCKKNTIFRGVFRGVFRDLIFNSSFLYFCRARLLDIEQ